MAQTAPLFTPEETTEIAQILLANIPGWKESQSTEKDLKIEKMNVTSANKIVTVELSKDVAVKKVVLKCPLVNPFQELFDLSEQNKVNNMITSYRGKKGLNPQVFFCNDKYRVEEFVNCTTFPFSGYTDPTRVKELAQILCDFHHDEGLKKAYIDLRGENTLKIRMQGMQKVFKKNFAQKKELVESTVPKEFQQNFTDFIALLDFLVDDKKFEKLLDTLFQDLDNGLYMSHNDPHMFNWIIVNGSTLQLIDFDGSNLSFPGCDLGYLFRATETDFSQGFKSVSGWDDTQKKNFYELYLTQKYNQKYGNIPESSLEEYLKRAVPELDASTIRGRLVSETFWILMSFGISSLIMYQWLGFDKVNSHHAAGKRVKQWAEENKLW